MHNHRMHKPKNRPIQPKNDEPMRNITGDNEYLKTGLIVGLVCAVVLTSLLLSGGFMRFTLAANNIHYVGGAVSERIIIVALDDDSFAAYGRSPTMWPRTLHAELIEALSDARARVVAFDLIFSESEPEDIHIVEALEAARQRPERARFVMAGAGNAPLPMPSSLSDHERGIRITRPLQANSQLLAAVDYVGFVDVYPDIDSAIRRQPSLIDLNDELALSFSLTTYLASLRIPPAAIQQVVTLSGDTLNVTPQRQITVDDLGMWMQNYFSTPIDRRFPIVSFRDIIEGEADMAQFEDKIVLVGVIDTIGATDRYPVPASASGLLMSGVEIHANAIETLIQNRPLSAQSRPSEILMIFAASIFASVSSGYLRWYMKIALWGVMMLVAVMVASWFFSRWGLVINLFFLWSALSIPILLGIGTEITTEIRRRRHADFLLNSVVQLEKQQLHIERIWPLIADDVRQIGRESKGAILAVHGAELSPVQSINGCTPDCYPQHIAAGARDTGKSLTVGSWYAAPISWQDHVRGVIVLEAKHNPHRTRKKLDDLARRIAPGIENAILHQHLRRQSETQETIFTNMPEAIIALDDDLRPLQWNAMFAALAPKSPDHHPDFIDILRENGLADHLLDEIKAQFQNGALFKREIGFGTRTFNMTAAPIDDSQRWVVILANITQIAELSQLKTHMIRMASHDLKNPLARVMGYTDLIQMQGGLEDPEQDRFLSQIANAGHEMLDIINDILNLEQLRNGDKQKELLDIGRLMREVCARYEPNFEQKSQALHINVADEPLVVVGNYRQISQMIANLLTNANKYTPEDGCIEVHVAPNGNKCVRLMVKDNGYGIPEDSQAKLFTDFYRVRTAETANIAGTGLGLSLVKSVIETHNGKIWLNSVAGEGTTFFVELPLV